MQPSRPRICCCRLQVALPALSIEREKRNDVYGSHRFLPCHLPAGLPWPANSLTYCSVTCTTLPSHPTGIPDRWFDCHSKHLQSEAKKKERPLRGANCRSVDRLQLAKRQFALYLIVLILSRLPYRLLISGAESEALWQRRTSSPAQRRLAMPLVELTSDLFTDLLPVTFYVLPFNIFLREHRLSETKRAEAYILILVEDIRAYPGGRLH